MQRCRRLCSFFEHDWRDKIPFSNDRQGRFNIVEAASELQLNDKYLASLYKPLHYTYSVKGQLYPAEQGRSSRPGLLASSRNRMFPLYRRDYGLDREMRHLSWRRITTE
ncbi:unnamed protein product [Phytomonas sp. Hart1]|nr:unnamed protein product [Phytomonas sp. Hart1]|eukprot:CCW72085.1 unnamed protein product [Phytomonas sp. isolate Hart1]